MGVFTRTASPAGAARLHDASPASVGEVSLGPAATVTDAQVRVDGKQFTAGGQRFAFRGVTYGTFRPRSEDGARFPSNGRLREDLQAIAQAAFTVVRTYTPPPQDLVEQAGNVGLRLLADAFYPDWRYLLGCSRREHRRVVREATAEVRAVARRLAGDPRILALSLGNEIPADVVRWIGTRRVAHVIECLAEVIREEDPDRLITYANYPSAEYLPLECLDFVTFNVFLERPVDFRSYLTRLHHLAGDRPLVLGETGLDAGTTAAGEQRQAEAVDWQLHSALERGVAGTCVFSWTDEWWVGEHGVEGWHFGLTRADRSPRPALAIAERWNRATVADVQPQWPSISVVICAYNAGKTLDECLTHTCASAYPGLEVLVVDDGSTDDTVAVARRHARARVIEIPHGGLSVARNAGFSAARGEIIAYLDSDAYPSPEWPYFLALGMDGPSVVGVGGPNIPPPSDPRAAQQVARAPGGPRHVLLSDARAEHIPGCNMAFWRELLSDIGGFDSVYTTAGDDVDLCWKVLDRGWEIGFHPAALVWHHARAGLRTYVRQQRGYGRAEALVEARHPHRYTQAGSARWHGHIYDSFAPRLLGQRVYRGVYGTAAFQSVYHGRNDARGLALQLGVPASTATLMTAPLALEWELLGLPALVALLFLVGLFVLEAASASRPRRVRHVLRFRCGVACLSMIQPLARTWGRTRQRAPARSGLGPQRPLPAIIARPGHNVFVLPEDRPREAMAAAIVALLRSGGLRVDTVSGWEAHDARLLASTLVQGKLVTSSHPAGCVQLMIRRRPRWRFALSYAAILVAAAVSAPELAGIATAAACAELGLGWWRTGPRVRGLLADSAAHAPDELPLAVGSEPD